MPAQLQKMEALNAILNLAGGIPAAPILLEYHDRTKVAATFEMTTRKAIKIAVPVKVETNKVEPNKVETPGLEIVKNGGLPNFDSPDWI